MSLKCHFDADGWLQGPISITHMTALTPNRYDSGFTDKARGLVQHTEDGFEGGTIDTFMNKASEVSAFFSVSEEGACHQYLPVGHGYVAWAQKGGNPYWRSCECEDKTRTGDPMTGPQMTAFAQILEACSAYDGFPLQITDDPVNGHGLITHGDGGVNWGNHPNCPGSTRKAQRSRIVALAMAIRSGQPGGLKTWQAAGQLSLHDLAAASLHQDAATTLALTARHSAGAVLAKPLASYVDTVFAGDASRCPAGVTWHYPGKGGMAASWKTKGELSLSALAAELGTRPSVVLQVTADVTGGFGPAAAGYVNAVFAGSALHLPEGTVLYYGGGS